MNDDLRDVISQRRSALNELDDGPRIGNIREGNHNATCEIESWREVLAECDGGRFGAVDLWSSEELPAYQNAPLPVDNAENYLVVGQILYEPIAMDKRTGTLHWLPIGASSVALGTTEHFLSHFVFGPGYSEIVPDSEEEPWWQFLSNSENSP